MKRLVSFLCTASIVMAPCAVSVFNQVPVASAQQACPANATQSNISVNCTGGNGGYWPDLCSPVHSFTIDTAVGTALNLAYTASSGHCAAIRVHARVDGQEIAFSPFVGYPGDPAGRPQTVSLYLGTVQPGTHTISLQGDIAGGVDCGGGRTGLASWGGTAVVTTTVNQCQQQSVPQCRDGIDNDGDGVKDFPADPGCNTLNDNDETNPAVTVCPQNLVQNNSFETPVIVNAKTKNLWQVYGGGSHPQYYDPAPPIAGWDPVSPYQVELQANGLYGSAVAGRQYAEIDAPGKTLLHQTVATTPGAQYQLRFFYAPRPDAGTQVMGVYWNGQLVGTAGGVGVPGGPIAWQQKIFTVTATGNTGTLGFGSIQSQTGAGNFLDAIILQKVGGCGTPVQPGLLAHYTFDDATGRDVTGNGHDAANNGAIPRNGCMDFNGVSSNMLATNAVGLPSGNNPRTVAYWFNVAQYQHNGLPFTLGTTFITPGSVPEFQRFATGPGVNIHPITNNVPYYGIFTDGVNGGQDSFSSNNVQITGNQIPPVNSWHHLAFTYNGNQGFQYYLDGVLTKSGTFGIPINTVTNALAMGLYPNRLNVGPGQTGNNAYYNGSLDDVRVYGSVLNAQQVAQLAQTPPSCVAIPQCRDGIDNDGDGATDHPADFSCSGPDDNDETNPRSQCQDGIDNDNDGKIDFPQDPGCSSKQDNDEFNTPAPQCSDGLDNDNDRKIDALDPGCYTNGFYNPNDNDETDTTVPQCRDGIDNDNDGATDFPNDFSCSGPDDNDETNQKSQCQDGIDNDGDALIDFPQDPGCSSKQDNDEFNQAPGADVSVTKSGPQSVTRGNVIYYTVTAANAGPGQATNVVIADVIPAGFTFNAGQSSAGCVLNGNGTSVLCNNFNLNSGANKSFTIAFNVPTIANCSAGSVQNQATVSTSSTDPSSGNNVSQTVSTIVNCPAVTTLPQCSDGIDNDADGKADYFDPGCYPNNMFDGVSYNPNDNDESNAAQLCRWIRVSNQWIRQCQ